MLIGNERAPRAFNGSESQRPREQNSGSVQGLKLNEQDWGREKGGPRDEKCNREEAMRFC